MMEIDMEVPVSEPTKYVSVCVYLFIISECVLAVYVENLRGRERIQEKIERNIEMDTG